MCQKLGPYQAGISVFSKLGLLSEVGSFFVNTDLYCFFLSFFFLVRFIYLRESTQAYAQARGGGGVSGQRERKRGGLPAEPPPPSAKLRACLGGPVSQP